MSNANNLASQQYWDSAYRLHQFALTSKSDTIRLWIENHFRPVTGKSCFEIGCFPGNYLSVFGELGYELNGIDVTPRVEKDMPEWLSGQHFKVGSISQADIFRFKSADKYDVVCSFGFIEHFKNWKEVIKIQAGLVKKGGYIVIETPNFRGLLQHVLHYLLDHENLKRHYLPSMHPHKWEKILKPLGFEIIYCNYFEGFDYWFDKAPEEEWRKKLWEKLRYREARMRQWKPNNALYSPYCGLIAKLK